jgi:preprotein translocase subunit SecF
MKIFKKRTDFDFMGKRKLGLVASTALMLIALGALPFMGLNLGLDFTGGTEVEVRFDDAPRMADVRSALANAGMNDAVVQTFGSASEILVRIPPQGEGDGADETATRVIDALAAVFGEGVEMRSSGFVGPQVGEELTEQGILAVIYALIGIFIYVMFRFQWRFSVGAVVATVHDILTTVGILSILQVSFDLTVVAALLAVVGYSLNDTIVVFDRIRENFPRFGKLSPAEVINRSVNETLSRTLVTSGTTLLVLLALFYFGGEIIHAFAWTLILGIVVGTYSSIFVASPILLMLGISKHDLVQVEKEGAQLDSPLP